MRQMGIKISRRRRIEERGLYCKNSGAGFLGHHLACARSVPKETFVSRDPFWGTPPLTPSLRWSTRNHLSRRDGMRNSKKSLAWLRGVSLSTRRARWWGISKKNNVAPCAYEILVNLVNHITLPVLINGLQRSLKDCEEGHSMGMKFQWCGVHAYIWKSWIHLIRGTG